MAVGRVQVVAHGRQGMRTVFHGYRVSRILSVIILHLVARCVGALLSIDRSPRAFQYVPACCLTQPPCYNFNDKNQAEGEPVTTTDPCRHSNRSTAIVQGEQMETRTILITGANGEIGHGLISHFAEHDGVRVVALDLNTLDDSSKSKCYKTYTGDILDNRFLESLSTAHDFDVIYHLAALLSTRAERQPTIAHKVNVDGTLNLLETAITQSRLQGKEVKMIYPSSIAVYGLPDARAKETADRLGEDECTEPRTMYGINKLYCERLGKYYMNYYRQLDAQPVGGKVDFRCVRFPGLISAVTLPTGGTSDFAPEMLHQAAKGEPYDCFVREDTRIPFMAMPDGVKALLLLEAAPKKNLSTQIYNVGSFNPSAGELKRKVKKAFPDAVINFKPDLKRQTILDSWPADVDDSRARKDWAWKPEYDFERAFEEYLVPAVSQFYKKK